MYTPPFPKNYPSAHFPLFSRTNSPLIWYIRIVIVLLILVASVNFFLPDLLKSPPPPTPLPTPTSSPPTPTQTSCKSLDALVSNYQYCLSEDNQNNNHDNYIQGPSDLRIDHVDQYTVSPSLQWVFVVRYSDTMIKNPKAPDESALTMLDIPNRKSYELFSRIAEVSFDPVKSWSKTGKGFVFAAGGLSLPNLTKGGQPFVVIYCETSCKVLAKNAGPTGPSPSAAYFAADKVVYSDKNGKLLTISP